MRLFRDPARPLSAAAAAVRLGMVLVGALALAVALLSSAGPALADYRLQKGDKIRLAIAGLPGSEVVSTVDLDGEVRFPRVGAFRAEGRTLAELRNAISVAAAGEVITTFRENGEILEIALDGTEIFVDFSEYRPVYLSGDVGNPGPIPFEPGMTVRTAIASAGGASGVPERFRTVTLEAPGLRSRFRSLSIAHAAATIRLWGIDALLARDGDAPAPDAARVAVRRGLFEDILKAERERVRYDLSEYRKERGSIEERLALLSSRLDLLQENLENQQETLRLEEEDLQRVETLRERGLAAATRVSDARQSLLVASTRILSVLDSIAQFELQKQELEQRLDTFEEAFEAPLVEERQEVSARIWDTASQLAGTRESMELFGLASRAADAPGGFEVSIRRVRTVDGRTTVDPVTPDSELLPGDVVEVTVRYDLPDAWGGELAGVN